MDLIRSRVKYEVERVIRFIEFYNFPIQEHTDKERFIRVKYYYSNGRTDIPTFKVNTIVNVYFNDN